MTKPDACIVSGADEIRLRSYIGHTVYARLYGLDYRLETGLSRGVENKFFYKMAMVEHVLDRYDWIVWLDDDCFITDFTRDTFRELIGQAERDDRFLVIAEGAVEPNGWWSRMNTGVFALRNDPRTRQMLRRMRDTSVAEVRSRWNEREWGLFTGGDQDVMCWALEETGLIDAVRIVEHRVMNSRPHHYRDSLRDAFVCHFAGYPDKGAGVVEFARRFGSGQELVPQELLDEFSVKVRDPLSPIGYAARIGRMRALSKAKRLLRPAYRSLRRRRDPAAV